MQNTYVLGCADRNGEQPPPSRRHLGSIGLLQPNNALTPGLSVGMLGTAAQINNLRPYPPPNPYIAVDAMPTFTAVRGPKHLLFSTPGNVYVLPSGFSVVDAPPPVISALAPAGNGSGNLRHRGPAIHAQHANLF